MHFEDAARGEPSEQRLSDARGVFFMDSLPSLPSQIRFERAGFNSQSVAVLPAAAGSAARCRA